MTLDLPLPYFHCNSISYCWVCMNNIIAHLKLPSSMGVYTGDPQ